MNKVTTILALGALAIGIITVINISNDEVVSEQTLSSEEIIIVSEEKGQVNLTVESITDNIASDMCEELEVSIVSYGQTFCLTENQYQLVKDILYGEYLDTSKEYDFDINNMELLGEVLSEEIERLGGSVTLTVKDTEDLKRQMINLLQ